MKWKNARCRGELNVAKGWNSRLWFYRDQIILYGFRLMALNLENTFSIVLCLIEIEKLIF